MTCNVEFAIHLTKRFADLIRRFRSTKHFCDRARPRPSRVPTGCLEVPPAALRLVPSSIQAAVETTSIEMPALIFFTESWLNSESASSLRDVMNTKTDKRVLKFGAEPHPCATERVPAMSWTRLERAAPIMAWQAQGNEGQDQPNQTPLP